MSDEGGERGKGERKCTILCFSSCGDRGEEVGSWAPRKEVTVGNDLGGDAWGSCCCDILRTAGDEVEVVAGLWRSGGPYGDRGSPGAERCKEG